MAKTQARKDQKNELVNYILVLYHLESLRAKVAIPFISRVYITSTRHDNVQLEAGSYN